MMFALEHFYYGQLVHHGKPTGELRVLARSAGIGDEQVQACVRHARIAPHPTRPDGAWGIVRGGRQAPYIFVQAQAGSAGQITHHFVLTPPDVLRSHAGNIQGLQVLVEAALPVYEMLGDTLPLISFPTMEERDASSQVDDLLNLMTYTHNNTRNIEPLIAAVVQNMPLAIRNAPESNEMRLAFIQGLLTLLPASTRFAVTFATYLEASQGISAQIAFYEGDAPEEAIGFDWETGTADDKEIVNNYARFIISQLRLDTEVVIQQTSELTPVAGWRFRNGDTLAEALDYASHRSRVDHAVRNGLPIEASEVARFLREDPTLSDETQAMYSRHLVNFSLALNEPEVVEPVGNVMTRQPELASIILRQLQDAQNEGKSQAVFGITASWLENPLAPQTSEWVGLLQSAAQAELNELVSLRDVDAILEFVEQVNRLSAQSGIVRVVPRLIEGFLPFASEDASLATQLLLMAMRHLPKEALERIMRARALAQHVAMPIKRFMAALVNPDQTPPRGTLVAAAEALGEDARDLALVRLAEMAYDANIYALIDTPTLESLVELATSPEGLDNAAMLIGIARGLESHVKELDPPGPRYVLQILLAIGRYDLLVQGMAEQSRLLYGGEGQFEYMRMVQELFARTTMTAEHAHRAIAHLSESGVKGIALLSASCGALEGAGFASDLADVASQCLAQLSENMRIQEVIHTELPLALLNFYVRQGDEPLIRRTARLVPAVAAYKEDKPSLAAINHAFKSLSADEKLRPIAFEVLCHYARLAQPGPAERVVKHFSKELPAETSRRLEFAHIFSSLMGRVDIETYSGSIQLTNDLLKANYETFMEKAKKPGHAQMINLIADFGPRLNPASRKEVVKHMRAIVQSIVRLGRQHQSHSSSSTKHLDGLIRGQEEPNSTLDILRVASGHVSNGRLFPLKFVPSQRVAPFGDIPMNDLADQLAIAADVLSSAADALPTDKAVTWRSKDITIEIETLLSTLLPTEAREIVRSLAINWQYLADTVLTIYHFADLSALEENSKHGRQLDHQAVEPRGPLEMYRFMYSYFEQER